MSTNSDLLDSILDSHSTDFPGSSGFEQSGTEEYSGDPWVEPGYTGKIDYRIRQLSYSSRLSLHTCPRKFELYKKRTTAREQEHPLTTITFAFGHVVGEAVQLALKDGVTEQEVIWKAFLGWHTDLFANDEKAQKSFWDAILAIKRFFALKNAGFLDNYELVTYQGKPACELSFVVDFPDSFRYRGHVDAVLQHKETKKVVVLELKTTAAASLHPSTYKNSAQAIGYSVVLDSIFGTLSSYDVIYLVYQTKSREYTQIPFTKTYLQRALWIREMLLDIEIIKMYEAAEVYPMYGESCNAFFRDCEYINTCTLSNEHITKPCTPEMEDKTEYQIKLTLADLLETQLGNVES